MNKRGQFEYSSSFPYWTLIILIVVALLGIFLFVILFTPAKLIQITDNGTHTGYVTAVERNGIIWKTWTAYFKTNTQSSQEDRYCVYDPEVISELKEVQSSNEQVTITYDAYLITGMSVCDVGESSHGIITGIA